MKPIRTADSLKRAWKRSGSSFVRFVNRLDREGIPYLSPSKLSCVERCPCCYYRQYVLGVNEVSAAMELGSLFHQAAKNFYAAFRAGRVLKPTQLLNRGKLTALTKESRIKLGNALALLKSNHWEEHEVVSIEEPFFMDLLGSLPPVIGIADLVLQRKGSFIVVDHKTSNTFHELDPVQLILYAEHVRREAATRAIVGVFDEYRLVPNLDSLRKPAFRRTPVSVDRSFLPGLVRRYREAWKRILAINRDGQPPPSPDCWFCNSASRWH